MSIARSVLLGLAVLTSPARPAQPQSLDRVLAIGPEDRVRCNQEPPTREELQRHLTSRIAFRLDDSAPQRREVIAWFDPAGRPRRLYVVMLPSVIVDTALATTVFAVFDSTGNGGGYASENVVTSNGLAAQSESRKAPGAASPLTGKQHAEALAFSRWLWDMRCPPNPGDARR